MELVMYISNSCQFHYDHIRNPRWCTWHMVQLFMEYRVIFYYLHYLKVYQYLHYQHMVVPIHFFQIMVLFYELLLTFERMLNYQDYFANMDDKHHIY